MNGITPVAGALQSAVGAINRSQTRLANDAAVVANPAQTLSKDVVAALIDARQQVLYTAAAAKLIAASDQMTQSLIDLHA